MPSETEAESRIKFQEARIDAQCDTIDTLRDHIHDQDDKIDKLERDIAEMSVELFNKDKKIIGLCSRVDEKDSFIACLKAEIESVRTARGGCVTIYVPVGTSIKQAFALWQDEMDSKFLPKASDDTFLGRRKSENKPDWQDGEKL